MRHTDLTAWTLRTLGIAAVWLVHGCGSFAFYEDTKVAIAIKVDPKAPDPVEVSAAYKESVYALVPMGRSNTDPQALVAGPVLSDFDVNYGANAGVLKNRDGDFLYAVITHGLATGKAATLLATRSIGTDQARRMVLITFLRQLSEADIKKAAAALSLGGIGNVDGATLRRRTIEAINSSLPSDLDQIENALVKTQFSVPFTPWKPQG
jgi:hypothetical protein